MNFIIDFIKDAGINEINQYLTDNQCSIIKSFDNLGLVYLVASTVQPPPASIVESIVDDDSNELELLTTITNDGPSGSFDLNDDNWWKTCTVKRIDLSAASCDFVVKGSQVSVYVLDSGIEASHPEFVDADITNLYSITGEYSDTRGHGTAIASLIAGKTTSLSNAKLKICKIFADTGSVKQSALLAAFDAVIADVADNPRHIAVMNCSWAISKNEYIDSKINLLIDQGVSVVAAAGNSGVAIDDVTPASIDRVITIGAYDQDFHPCDFSNYTGSISTTPGATNHGALDGWAPGQSIRVAALGGAYGISSGTSLSAAIHSCVVAYNSVNLLGDDGLLMECHDEVASTIKELSLNRRNLLIYTDAKYDGSVNLISTLYNDFAADMVIPSSSLIMAAISGKPTCARLFNPLLIQSYDITTPLPSGLSVGNNGSIYGTVTIQEDYKIFTAKSTLTFKDGTTMDQDISICVSQPTFDLSTVPVNDPVINVVLMVCSGSTCGSCGAGQQCQSCNDGKTVTCSCICSACEPSC